MKIGDGATFNEVLERCAEHAIFLVCQFTQESLELIDWKQTLFYKWFTTEHAVSGQLRYSCYLGG